MSKEVEASGRRRKSKPLNWNKFTNFRSQRTRKDLEELCKDYNQDDLERVFSTYDETGLCPIHWAAIHNRSDLIELMVNKGSHMRIKCKNKLFANGTALHLASMNGSIEAAQILLEKCDTKNQSRVKTLTLERNDTNENDTKVDGSSQNWLIERDLEGQTALMRSAAPKTKRLATVRDLLRKNFWSLNGRPAEMALFLISKGADWREVDSINGMNLLHLAIVHDYSDTINLLLVIDSSLASTVVRIGEQHKQSNTQNLATTESTSPSGNSSDDDSTSTQLTSPEQVHSPSDTTKLLIRREKLKRLDFQKVGLTPLQLAIIYGRLSIITLIWNTTIGSTTKLNADLNISSVRRYRNEANSPTITSDSEARGKKEELRRILFRAFLANGNEVFRLIKDSSLRFLLAADLVVLTLIWMPVYLTNNQTSDRNVLLSARSGVFITTYCITLALAFRVMLKNPGYLRRHSMQYIRELVQIVGPERIKTMGGGTNETRLKQEAITKSDLPASNEQQEQPQSNHNQQPQTNESSRLLKQSSNSDDRSQMKLTDRIRVLCHKCRCIRKARSRHCNYCDHCVQDFDHHCAYLGCCVGRKNRLDFLLMLIMLTLTSTYGTFLHTTSLKKDEWTDVWHFIGLVWILKYVLIGFFSAFFMIRRACLGITMYESIRSRRILSIFGPGGPPKSISKSHRLYSLEKGSFWRHSPDRFLDGDLSMKKILYNLNEFTSFTSFGDYFLTVVCADTALAKSLVKSDAGSTRIELYKLV